MTDSDINRFDMNSNIFEKKKYKAVFTSSHALAASMEGAGDIWWTQPVVLGPNVHVAAAPPNLCRMAAACSTIFLYI